MNQQFAVQAVPVAPVLAGWLVILLGLMLMGGIAIAIYHGKGKVLLAIFGAGTFALFSLALMQRRPMPTMTLAPPVVVAPELLPQELSPPKIALDPPAAEPNKEPSEYLRLFRTAIDILSDLEQRTKELRTQTVAKSSLAAEVAKPEQSKLPEWITSPVKPVGNVWRAVVNAGPYSTADEARAELSAAVLAKTQDYLRDEFGFEQPAHLALTGAEVVERLVTQQHVAEQELTFGTMFTAYAQLEIDSSNRAWLEHRVQQLRQQVAVRQVGGLGAVVLGGLASVLGLLKIDESTQGRFRKRLLLGGPAAIVGLVLAASKMLA